MHGQAGSERRRFSASPKATVEMREPSLKGPSGESSSRWWLLVAVIVAIPSAAYAYRRSARPALGGGGGAEQVGPEGRAPDAAGPSALAKGEDRRVFRTKYLLVGGGTAAFAALQEIRQQEPGADITMVTAEHFPPYLRPPLSKELWFAQGTLHAGGDYTFSDWHGERQSIFYQPLSFYNVSADPVVTTKDKPRLIVGNAVEALDVEKGCARLASGATVHFERVLLAMGATPKHLPDAGSQEQLDSCERGGLLSTFRGLADFERIHGIAGEGERHIVVVGGSFLGTELAVALSQRATMGSTLRVSQVFAEDAPMSTILPRTLSQWVMKVLRRAGVRVYPQRGISDVRRLVAGDTGGVEPGCRRDQVRLTLDDKTVIVADHVVVALGTDANVSLARAAGLPIDEDSGGVRTDEFLAAHPLVYVAGDCLAFPDRATGATRRVEHYENAVLSGRLAGANMALDGRGSPLQRQAYEEEPFFWSDLGPHIGCEAVGRVDATLRTVSVWASRTKRDSPTASALHGTDVRTQLLGGTRIRSAGSPEPGEESEAGLPLASSVIPDAATSVRDGVEPVYGKGVVFYLDDDDCVAGMLMFNIFNCLSLAKDTIRSRRGLRELQSVIDLIDLNGEK